MSTTGARGEDAQELADIALPARQDRLTPDQVKAALNDAVIPDLAELSEAFERPKPHVLNLVRPVHA